MSSFASRFTDVLGMGEMSTRERAARVHVTGFVAAICLTVVLAMLIMGFEHKGKGFANECNADSKCAEHYCRDINGNPVAGCNATCFAPTKQCVMQGAAGAGTEVRVGGSKRARHVYLWTVGVLAFFGGLNFVHGLVAAMRNPSRSTGSLWQVWGHFLAPMVPGILIVLGIVFLVMYGMKHHQSQRCARTQCRDREGRELEGCNAQPQTSSDGKKEYCTVDTTGTVIGWELQHENLYFGLGLGITAFAVLGYSGYWMYALNVLGLGRETTRVLDFAEGRPGLGRETTRETTRMIDNYNGYIEGKNGIRVGAYGADALTMAVDTL